jgi:hypothetical protein
VTDIRRNLTAKPAGIIAETSYGTGIVANDTNIAISSKRANANDLFKKI